MLKYLLQGSYTTDGVKGLLKEGGTSRRATIEQLARGLGGEIEAFYFGFGEDDVFVIADVPDQVTMTAICLAVGASGAINLRTTVLIDPEEVDEATKKVVSYRPPGG